MAEEIEHGTAHTTQEIADFTAKQQRIEQYAKASKDALQLLDLQNPPTKTYTVYSKELLRTYLKNPLSDQNQKNLRNVSQFLYYLSFQLRRTIAYYASQVDLSVYSVIPNVSLIEKNDKKSILKNYEEALKWIEKMNMNRNIYDPLVIAWREDAFFGYIYYSDDGDADMNNFVIVPLNGNYCKISSVNYDGTFNIAYDFSFFSGSNEFYLEYWDKEFTTKYNAYKSDSKLRWQELDPERTFCIKVNSDQSDRVIPPLASLYESIIDIIDLQGITNVKDNLSIYKLLVAEIDTLSNAKEPDDFAIDLNTAVDFYNKMVANLPDEVGAVLSPMKITPVEFNKDASSDTNAVSNAMSNLWESAGVSQVLDKNLTGASAIKFASIAAALMATKPILPQIEARVNRFLDYVLPNNGMRIRYFEGLTPFNKEDKIKQVKEAASLGLPVKTLYCSLVGLSPLDTNSMCYLENDVLKLDTKFKPLQSSYTQSGKTTTKSGNDGAPEKSDGELTDEGSNTKEKEKNKA